MDALGKKTELLITMISENDFSYMFHKPNIMHTKLQAEALGDKAGIRTRRRESRRRSS